MRIKRIIEERKLEIWLEGEIDHHAAHDILVELSDAVDEALPLFCTLDLSAITFMDSSGIAVILGLHRRLHEIGGILEVHNAPKQANRVIKAAGIDRIIPVSVAV